MSYWDYGSQISAWYRYEKWITQITTFLLLCITVYAFPNEEAWSFSVPYCGFSHLPTQLPLTTVCHHRHGEWAANRMAGPRQETILRHWPQHLCLCARHTLPHKPDQGTPVHAEGELTLFRSNRRFQEDSQIRRYPRPVQGFHCQSTGNGVGAALYHNV